MPNLTPEQKIKHLILIKDAQFSDKPAPVYDTAAAIEDDYDALVEREEHWDSMNEVRHGHEETNIPAPGDRHLESKSVGARYVDGSWIGWTFWFGGGKHAEPESVDWMDQAYDLTIVRTETIVRNVFAKGA